MLTKDGRLLREGTTDLEDALAKGEVLFHPGSIRGAFPRLAG